MPIDMRELADDLTAETTALREMVAGLDEAAWRMPTPAEGWTVADQISHLAFFDDAAIQSAADPEGFAAELERAMTVGELDPDDLARRYRSLTSADLLAWFDASRRRLIKVFAELDPALRLPWFGLPMSAASSLTARIMETWAHGLDVADVGFGAAWAGHRSGWARFGQNCVRRATPGSTRIVSGRFRSPVTPGSPSPEPDLGRSVPLRSAWRPRGPARALPGRRRRRV